MIYGMYAIFDAVSALFSTPMADIKDEVAIRNFRFSMNQAKDVRSFSPVDYSLYRVGSYDDTTGQLVEEVPRLLDKGVWKPLEGEENDV